MFTGVIRGERVDDEDIDGEEDKKKGSICIYVTTEGVWIQVAHLSKFGVPNFDFASSWT
jgi:hypothetical protein